MKNRILFNILVIFGFSAVGIAEESVVNKPNPNIVFILADDLGYGEVGCYGQEKIYCGVWK